MDQLDQLQKSFDEQKDAIQNFTAEAKTAIEKNGDLSKEAKQTADEMLVKFNTLAAQITDLELKAGRRAGPGAVQAEKSLGERFVDNDDVKALMSRKSGKASMSVKAVTSAGASAGTNVRPDRLGTVVTLPERRMTVRDLITQGRTSSNSIEYVREKGFTNNAGIQVNEGDLKAQSDLTFELVTRSVATLAHWLLASKQILDDAPGLQSFIDGRMRYGLDYVEELQLLKGTGTNGNLEGLITVASDYNASLVPGFTGATPIDTLRLAMLQAVLAEYPATGHVLHPIDWAQIELTKDDMGRYIFANPQGLAQPTMWGLPVVATQAIDRGSFLTGAFRLGAQVFDREDANVLISTEDSDNFRRNMVTIRAEERLALAIYRPEAFVTGTFTTGA